MKALVTGGAGFIGSNVALELERAGHQVTVLDDFSGGHFENLKGFGGDVVTADISVSTDWIYRVGPIDAIFHEAAITDTTVTDQKRMMQVNVEGFRNLLYFATESGIKQIVYASSAGVYGSGSVPMREGQEMTPNNVYAFSKMTMERVAEDYSRDNPEVRLIGLRYFNVYGPRESFKGKAASMIWQLSQQMTAGKRPRIFKWGEQFRDFIYVKDVVAANLQALDAEKNGVYNVCTGKKAAFNRIIEVLNSVHGTSLQPDYFDNPYAFYQNETLGDPAAAAAALKFEAAYSIEKGIKDYLGGKQEPAKQNDDHLPASDIANKIRPAKSKLKN